MLKISRSKDKKIRIIVTIIACFILIILGIRYVISKRIDLILDVLVSIITIGTFYKFYHKLHQDYKSYFFLIFALILHDFFFYGTKPLGIKFEHYMHFVGGFTIAIITDRVFNEKLSRTKRFLLLMIFALGIGVIGEIIEWLGFKVLGLGEGFFKYGVGDEGEWDNSIIDLFFNSFGASIMAIFTLFRKK